MERYLIKVEKANGNYSGSCPDLPGCVATGKTRGELLQHMSEALKLHLEGMGEDKVRVGLKPILIKGSRQGPKTLS
jgi:predicted RNase H-like HicB family nuclease